MKAKLGSGARFAAVERSAAASGASDPAAVAAAVGIKKYGKAKMASMAAAGRRHGSPAHEQAKRQAAYREGRT